MDFGLLFFAREKFGFRDPGSPHVQHVPETFEVSDPS
jgi:hypothetical protein